MSTRARRRSRGQAMTETVIVASFVLIPLFLLIPFVGKLIDIRHTTIEAARYEAWEWTVWYADNGETPIGFTHSQPVKSENAVEQETRRRFFSRPGLPIRSTDSGTGWTASDANPLWTDHRGGRLYNGDLGRTTPSGVPSSDIEHSESTPTVPVIGDVFDVLLDIIDTVFSAIAEAMSVLGSPIGFDAINTEGYAKATVVTPIDTPPGLVDVATISGSAADTGVDVGTLYFRGHAGVLTDAWNAGGVRHTYARAGGIVPTTLLNGLIDAIPGLPEVLAVVTYLTPELRLCNPPIWHPADLDTSMGKPPPDQDGSLWLGYIDIDAVPPDRLETTDGDPAGDINDCPDGMCDYAMASGVEMAQSPCDF